MAAKKQMPRHKSLSRYNTILAPSMQLKTGARPSRSLPVGVPPAGSGSKPIHFSVKGSVKGSVLGTWYSFIFFCLTFKSMSTDLPIFTLFHPNPQPMSSRKYQFPRTDPFRSEEHTSELQSL